MMSQKIRSEILSKDFLEECFIVNFEEGTLVWKTRPLSHFKSAKVCKIWNSNYAGKSAGSVCYKTRNYYLSSRGE